MIGDGRRLERSASSWHHGSPDISVNDWKAGVSRTSVQELIFIFSHVLFFDERGFDFVWWWLLNMVKKKRRNSIIKIQWYWCTVWICTCDEYSCPKFRQYSQIESHSLWFLRKKLLNEGKESGTCYCHFPTKTCLKITQGSSVSRVFYFL